MSTSQATEEDWVVSLRISGATGCVDISVDTGCIEGFLKAENCF